MTELLHKAILDSAPRILCLLDKNPLSPSYGSFDRKYWQYKILDFPCGMQQELVLPLAYLWKTPFLGNEYHGQPRVAEFIAAALRYHSRAMHPDGSLDDYFPHERAFGATAYALAALTEASLLSGILPPEAMASLRQSGRFLASYREAGSLSNHLAIAALALANLARLTGESDFEAHSRKLVDELASRQHAEGWFPEYEGCDLGYQTVTIEFLARQNQALPSSKTEAMLRSATDFLLGFAHPDGSLGGEYGSRNTYNFYPGGFAVLAPRLPSAASMLSLFVKGLMDGAANHLDDDGVFGHLLSSYVTVLTAERCPLPEAAIPGQAEQSIQIFPGAGLFRASCGKLRVFGNTTKGGAMKIFSGDTLVWSDTGLAGVLGDGSKFCQNKPGASTGALEGDALVLNGNFMRYSPRRLSRLQMAGLRLLSLAFGAASFYSHAIRILMQQLLIYKKQRLPLSFRRVLRLEPERIVLEDSISTDGALPICELWRSTDLVNLHVVTSDSFQKANLLPWVPLTPPAGHGTTTYLKVFKA